MVSYSKWLNVRLSRMSYHVMIWVALYSSQNMLIYTYLILTEPQGAGRCHHTCPQYTCEDSELREWRILSRTASKKVSQDSNSPSSFRAFRTMTRCLLGYIQIICMDMDPCPLETESSKQTTQVFICNPHKTKLPYISSISTVSLPKKHTLTSKKNFEAIYIFITVFQKMLKEGFHL